MVEGAVIRRVAASCRRGFDEPGLPDGVRAELQAVLPHDLACWGVMDPTTLWPLTTEQRTGRISRGQSLGVRAARPRREQDRGPRCTSRAVGGLGQVTAGEVERSARYRSVLSRIGVHDELRAVLRIGGVSWGWLALFRLGPPRFSEHDIGFLARIAPHLAHAWRAALLTDAAGAGELDQPPAILVLDDRDEIESMTPAAQELLSPRVPGPPDSDMLHALAVAARTGAPTRTSPEFRGSDSGPPVKVTVPRSDGSWLVLDAAPLIGRGERIGVTIRAAGRTELSEVLLRSFGLTNREVQVALAALRNETNTQIADSFFLSPWTVQDHLKAVFAKTGTRTRRDLMERLLPAPAHGSAGGAGTARRLDYRFPAPPSMTIRHTRTRSPWSGQVTRAWQPPIPGSADRARQLHVRARSASSPAQSTSRSPAIR